VEFHETAGFAPLPAPGLQKQYELLLYFACPGAPDLWNSMILSISLKSVNFIKNLEKCRTYGFMEISMKKANSALAEL